MMYRRSCTKTNHSSGAPRVSAGCLTFTSGCGPAAASYVLPSTDQRGRLRQLVVATADAVSSPLVSSYGPRSPGHRVDSAVIVFVFRHFSLTIVRCSVIVDQLRWLDARRRVKCAAACREECRPGAPSSRPRARRGWINHSSQ